MNDQKTKPVLIVNVFWGRLLSFLGWIWTLFWGVGFVAILFSEEGIGVKIFFFLLVLFGIHLIRSGRRRTKLCADFKKYVVILSDDPGRSIDRLADQLGISVNEALENLEKMRDKKFFKEVSIDYVNRRLFFPNDLESGGSDVAHPEPSDRILKKCGGCGASNMVGANGSYCEYCGAFLTAD